MLQRVVPGVAVFRRGMRGLREQGAGLGGWACCVMLLASVALAAPAPRVEESGWRSATVPQLATAAKALATGKTADPQALSRLAAVAVERFGADLRAGVIDWASWFPLAEAVGNAWPEDAAKAMGLDLTRKLENAALEPAFEKWMAKPAQMAKLIPFIRQLGDHGRPVWPVLARGVDERYITDGAGVATLGPAAWAALGEGAKSALTPEMKERWIRSLSAAALGDDGDPKKPSKLTASQFVAWRKALMALDAAEFPAVAAVDARLFAVSNAVGPVSRWTPKDWAELAKALPLNEPANQPLAALGIGWLDAHRLDTVEHIRLWSLSDWRSALGPWIHLGSDADRQRRGERLADAMGSDPQALSKVTVNDAKFFAGSLEKLSPPAAGKWVANYLSAQTNPASLDKALLTRLMRHLVVLPPEQARPSLERLDRALLDDPAMPWQQTVTMVITWSKAGDKSRAQTWARRLYQIVLGSPEKIKTAEQDAIMDVAAMSLEAGLEPQPGGHVEFAQALANVIRENRGHWVRRGGFWRWGFMCDDPASIAELEKAILDPQGIPRSQVVKTLAWAHAYAGTSDQWLAHVQKQLDDPTCAGDKKAIWLVARGWIAAAQPPYQNLVEAMPMLTEAAEVATTRAVMLSVHTDMIEALTNSGQRQEAIEYCARQAAIMRFTDDEKKFFDFVFNGPK